MRISDGTAQGKDVQLDADVVVVGSGASGAVVASILAEAGQDVLVLEEGSHVRPEVYGAMRPSTQMRTLWRDAGLTFAVPLGDTPVINVMMGKAVGGSSLLTGGVCFRIPDKVLHTWHDEHGLSDMTPAALEPAFQSVEARVKVSEVPTWMRSPSTNIFGEGLKKATGHVLKPLKRNMEGCQGHSRCNFGCPAGAKLSVDRTYLPHAVEKGARVYSHALVDKVLIEGDRAVGVRGRWLNGPEGRRTGRFTVRARRVVVAAGGYHSPLLLMRSGVGRASDQVGRNLTLHPSFRVMARFDQAIHGWRGALQTAYSDAYNDERYQLTGMFTPAGVLAATMPGIGPRHVARAREVAHLAVFGALIHDDGGGRVRRGIGREPFVTYRLAREDAYAMGAAMRTMGEAFLAAGAKEIFLPILGMEGLTPDQFRALDLERLPRNRVECASQHPLGTCRMGRQPGSSVVNPDGECWEVKELFLSDGSVLPTSLGVNPQVAIMTLATRLGWKLRERKLPVR